MKIKYRNDFEVEVDDGKHFAFRKNGEDGSYLDIMITPGSGDCNTGCGQFDQRVGVKQWKSSKTPEGWYFVKADDGSNIKFWFDANKFEMTPEYQNLFYAMLASLDEA